MTQMTQRRVSACVLGCYSKRTRQSFERRVAKQACPSRKPARRLG